MTTEPPEELVADQDAATDLVFGQALSLTVSAAHSVRALIGLKLQTLGMVPGQDRLLLRLQQHGPIGIGALANTLNIRPSTVSKMLDRLTEKGLVRRVENPLDLRRTTAALTDKGRDACNDVIAVHQATEAELRAKLGEDDTLRIIESLSKLEEVLTRQLRRQR